MISSSTSWGQETHYSALPLIRRKWDRVTHHQELTTLPITRYNKWMACIHLQTLQQLWALCLDVVFQKTSRMNCRDSVQTNSFNAKCSPCTFPLLWDTICGPMKIKLSVTHDNVVKWEAVFELKPLVWSVSCNINSSWKYLTCYLCYTLIYVQYVVENISTNMSNFRNEGIEGWSGSLVSNTLDKVRRLEC